MTHIKICGIKSADHGNVALELGADMLGFIFYRPVPRYIPPGEAAGIVRRLKACFSGWQAVGVFVDEPADTVNEIAALCQLDIIQLAGDEPPSYCSRLIRPAIKVLRVREGRWDAERLSQARAGYRVERFMVDSHLEGLYGGTGVAAEWASLSGLLSDCILAGGLRADNVASALALTNPWGVDVSTGVETQGQKDPALIRQFISAVRSHDATRADAGTTSAGRR